MSSRARDTFTTIRTEGALLPPDLLQRISEGANLDGLTPESYHRPGEKLNEAINRSWNALQGVWASFRAAQERLPQDDLGTSITRERWLLPLFRELDYGRLQTATAVEIDGRSYPISHGWEQVPAHLVSYKLELDRRTPGATGAASASPHSLLQVFLNRSEENLWGFLSNGYKLRILRDNVSLTRQAYVEFDLEAMMEGEVYSDFVLLWLLCHQSRVEGERPSDCWLERWMKVAEDQGTRALDQLRDGVEQAIEALGLGFLEHPANYALRDQLTSGDLSAYDYYHQLLRMVYRLLFLFVAEDRDLLLDPAAGEAAHERYIQYYSTHRLRRMAEVFKGTRHPDLFEGLRLVMRLLSGDSNGAGAGLALVPLGSFLFSDRAVADVIDCQIANSHLLDAIRALSLTYDQRAQVYRTVDYKNLGSDELGSIFESLLELHPQINVSARRFALATAAGNERKTTGSYYTPESLVHALLDTALNPVLDEATRQGEATILDLKVCDPACGSGHFLIAAANRMAKALAFVRTDEEEPPPAAIQEAKRDIISHCIYGVDINPMAVELCKVNLWMEALEPGKPLSFLDHRIQCGNSLLGTTPKLMANGIPDDAFKPIEGDNKAIANALRKQNRQDRQDRETGQRSLFDLLAPPVNYARMTRDAQSLDALDDETLAAVRSKETAYQSILESAAHAEARFLADMWCSAFVWDKIPADPYDGSAPPPTDWLYRRYEEEARRGSFGTSFARPEMMTAYEVERLRDRYQFFHWHVAFPDVFSVPDDLQHAENEQTGWNGGFDVILGNPPWERIKIQEREFFAARDQTIALAKTASARKKLIQELKDNNPSLLQEFMAEKRIAEATSSFIRQSGCFQLTAVGDVNTYPLFAELGRTIINQVGRAGLIIPSGIATDDSTKDFFANLIETQSLVRLFGFTNWEFIFPDVGHRFSFCLITMSGSEVHTEAPELLFYAHNTGDLAQEERLFRLSTEDINLINPNNLGCPTFRTKKDAILTKSIYSRIPVLVQEKTGINHWGISFLSMFHMANDSSFFSDSSGPTRLPLYEAKMFSLFDHRYGYFTDELLASDQSNYKIIATPTLELYSNPTFAARPRYYVEMDEVARHNSEKWQKRWFIAFRSITLSVNERTAIASILPYVAVGHSAYLIIPEVGKAQLHACLLANICSLVFDYVTRQKFSGTNFSLFIIKQLPVVPPHTYLPVLLEFIVPRVLELTYTAWDLEDFAHDVGYDDSPFVWDEERRFLIRCELDALFIYLYGLNREETNYVLDPVDVYSETFPGETFRVLKEREIAEFGEFRTKRVILEIYDQMAALPVMHVPAPKDESATVVVPDVSQWETWLNPPPADPAVAHSSK